MSNWKNKISDISHLHYIKLVCRSALFIAALTLYIINKLKKSEELFLGIEHKPIILTVIWVVFVIEMILRFFPAKVESMGCQKQFERNYIPSGETVPDKTSWVRTFVSAASWILLNAIIGFLYFLEVYDAGILVLLALAFSVCDMICILFFCPFQTWILKNKCCTTCRIYNWDYAMMFTPLVFICNAYALTLVILSLLLLIKWEIVYKIHPERYTENTNESLACKNCKEKLCQHKTQLRSFLKKRREFAKKKAEKLNAKLKAKTEKLNAKIKAKAEKLKNKMSKK